ncbi:penicillin-binding protein activator [Natronospirillum operosum]|nr:penicillin-binding protein activator [Natronospirillum operosum]
MNFALRLPALLTVLILAACSTPPVSDAPDDTATGRTAPEGLSELPLDTDRPIAELADELPDDLKRSELIRLNRAPQTAEGYTLELAKIFYLRGEPDKTERLLNRLDYPQLSATMQRDFALLSAKTELMLFNPRASLAWLTGDAVPLFDSLPLPQQIEISLLRAQAYSLTNSPVAAARERIFIHPLLTDEQKHSNVQAIWLDLQQADPEALAVLAMVQTAPDYSGWLELANIYHEYQNEPMRLVRGIEGWQQANPRHPAALDLPDSLLRLTESISSQPEHIALILPVSGDLRGPGQAIADGFLAGYFRAKNEGQDVPELRFYDEANGDVRQVVTSAIEAGADFIIGPLGRNQVMQVESVNSLPVTVMALNRTDRQVINNENVIQFALAPEDEARQVARHAWFSGHNVAAAIRPQGEWGERVASAFREEWERLGGQLVSTESIPAQDDGRRYLAQVRSLLDIDQSQQRSINIQSVLGTAVEIEPRRRRDLDFIFMAVEPDQARQLRPLLNFQYAEDIPILATSSIVATNDTGRDRDLSGIRLVEIPWLVSDSAEAEALAALDIEQFSTYSRLYAMGLDAWHLVPQLPYLRSAPEAQYRGQTGILRLNERGQIERELAWAQYMNGRLVPLTLSPTLEAEESPRPLNGSQ